MAPNVSHSIDVEEPIVVLQDLDRIRAPYFEEAKAGTFVHDWHDERDPILEYHHVNEPGPTGFEGHNVVAGVR